MILLAVALAGVSVLFWWVLLKNAKLRRTIDELRKENNRLQGMITTMIGIEGDMREMQSLDDPDDDLPRSHMIPRGKHELREDPLA